MDLGGVIAPVTGTKTGWTEIKSLLCPTPQSAQGLAPTYLSDPVPSVATPPWALVILNKVHILEGCSMWITPG